MKRRPNQFPARRSLPRTTKRFQAPGWEGKVSAWSDWYALAVSIDLLLVRVPVWVQFCAAVCLLLLTVPCGWLRDERVGEECYVAFIAWQLPWFVTCCCCAAVRALAGA